MTLAAIDDVDDALQATRALLFPFDAKTWLRLAVVAFFVGGAGGAGSGSGGGGGGSGGGGSGGMPTFDGFPVTGLELTNALVAGVLALVALALLVGLVFAVVAAIMEFVLVESLRTETVHLRQYARRYWRGGVRLFAFRLVVGLLGAGLIVGTLLVALFGIGVFGPSDPGLGRLLGGLLLTLPLVLAMALVLALVLGLTTDFVVPVMLLEGTTVLGGWRRFWPTLRADWQEYVVYVLVSFVLKLVVGVAVAIVVGIAAVVLLLPLGLVAVAGLFATGGQFGVGAWVGLGLLVLLGILVLAVVGAVVQVPVVTYFRYYALLVLGDTDDAFDVIAERRAAIRSDVAAA